MREFRHKLFVLKHLPKVCTLLPLTVSKYLADLLRRAGKRMAGWDKERPACQGGVRMLLGSSQHQVIWICPRKVTTAIKRMVSIT